MNFPLNRVFLVIALILAIFGLAYVLFAGDPKDAAEAADHAKWVYGLLFGSAAAFIGGHL